MSNAIVTTGVDLPQDKIELIKRTIAKGASTDELALFIEQCKRTGLDPFARQIYSVRRKQWNATSRGYEEAQVIQVSIDGFRLIADRTHKYAGQVGPWWCGPDGEWREVWLEDTTPAAAKVGVLRHDFHQPMYSIALYKSYVQTNSHGEPISRWKTDPVGMLAKCAEALALRRAFPHELSGLYTTEEMDQADNPQAVAGTWQAETPTNGNRQHAPQLAEPQAPPQPEEPSPFDEPEPPAEPTWDAAAIADILAKYPMPQARLNSTLKYCGLPKDTPHLREWMDAYKANRDQGLAPQEAGPKADIAVVAVKA